MIWSVLHRNWFAIFKVKVLTRAHNLTLSIISSKLLICLQPNMICWCIIISQTVLFKICVAVFKVKVTAKEENVSECLEDIFLTGKYFVTKHGMMMHHYKLEVSVEKLFCCLPGQGHSKGSNDQNMTVSAISFELLSLFSQTWFYGTVL